MAKKYILLLISCLGYNLAIAQTPDNAFLYSNSSYRGSSRFLAAGNASSAVGGNSGLVNINPAGMGINQKGKFELSGLGYINRTEAQLSNSPDTSFTNNFKTRFSNVSLLLAAPVDSSKIKQVAFAISYNNTLDLQREWNYKGENFGSILSHYAQLANGNSPQQLDPFSNQMAYDAHLINLSDSNNLQYNSALADADLTQKKGNYKSTGRNYELGLSAAINLQDKLWIGSTIGLNTLRHNNSIYYEEQRDIGTINEIRTFSSQNRNVKGIGVNLKTGILYKLNRYFNIAAHAHTPTFYSNRETFFSNLTGTILYNGWITTTDRQSAVTNSRYSFRTPWVFGLAAAFHIEKKWFINAEIERVDYRQMSFKTRSGAIQNSQELNSAIDNNFKPAYRFRIGSECTLIPKYNFAVGYQIQSNPYSERRGGASNWQRSLHFGIGKTIKGFEDIVFMDFTCVVYNNYQIFSPYNFNSSVGNGAVVKINSFFVLLSLSFSMKIS